MLSATDVKPLWIVTSKRTKTDRRAPGYLHGYSAEEQSRLYEQAEFLEPYIYPHVHFQDAQRLLEVGCGVGAQTGILLKRFPKLKIDSVDASGEQLKQARKYLKAPIKSKQVVLHQADATDLPFTDSTHDSAFVCWLLEHLKDPIPVLKEIHRCLKEGGTLNLNEALNHTFFVSPYSPATLQYWFEYNDQQWNLGGDPFVGAKLGQMLSEVGFQQIELTPVTIHCDRRTPKIRAKFIDFWIRLLLSAAPSLLASKKIQPSLLSQVEKELEALRNDPNSVFIFGWIHATAKAF